MKNYLVLLLFTCLMIACSNKNNIVELENESFKISIDNRGLVTQIIDLNNGVDYLSTDTTSSLVSIKVDGKILLPISAQILDEENMMKFTFNEKYSLDVKYWNKEEYIKFEIISATGNEDIELAIWGPYSTKINNVIGETIGVVQSEDYAIGLQALNEKTLGGYPWTDNDCMPQINIFNQDDYTDLSEEGKDYVLYRVEAAIPTKSGSSLQAYCRNRDKERVIENLQHEYFVSQKFDDGGIINSKIAIFGCKRNNILPTIEKIELSEGLPHPMLEGEWGKISKGGNRAYIIYSFSEETIERAIEITKQAGLKYLYHPGPFKNWGHFDLRDELFPNGEEGLRKCVEIAKQNGIVLGVHTLSNFITTDDKYVTPIPDRRLGIVGSSIIEENISKDQKTILIQDPKFFNQYKNNSLKTVRINDELIRYASVSEEKPWKLLDCERGAFGTNKSSHSSGDSIVKLADHPYKVFLTDPELSLEVSKNIGEFFNRTGVRFISFDGLEGNRSTGMGNYGEILFTTNWYNTLADSLKQNLITHASRTSHYFWHLYTRMNWGEPWYAGFRESQTSYRMKNQEYFQRNLMPGMLGWFLLKPETTVEDIEWMLTRSAAYNAGYAFVVSDEAIAENKNSDKIFNLIKDWEEARLSGAIGEELQVRMKNMSTEFSLESVTDSEWNITEVFSHKFNHIKKTRQPGEPLYSTFNFENKSDNEKVDFIITADKCKLKNIKIEFDNYRLIQLPITLDKNQSFKYAGGTSGGIYSITGEKIKTVSVGDAELRLKKGNHSFTFDSEIIGDEESKAKIELRFFGNIEKLTSN